MKKIPLILALTVLACLGFSGRLLAQTDGSVSFQVTTLRTYVDRDPKNIMAIWVTDGQGAFVKTLKKRAVEQEAFLYQWIASSKKNVADAITGATLSTQQTHQVTWNCRNAAGTLVTNGVYRIMVEMTTQNGQGPVTPAGHIQFTKGPSGATVIPANLTYFSGMSLVYTPLVVHDVAVSTLSPTTGVAGATIPITIAVTNLQPTTESFTVVLSNLTSGVLIGSAAVASLGPQKGTNVTINWNTAVLAAGGYSLKAAAGAVAGETSLANNTLTAAFTLSPPIPDIAITALAPASGIAGDTIPVTVSITNRQKTTESFSVVLSNQTSGVLIGSAAVATLGPQRGTNVAISWNTAAVTPGGYTLKAVAGPVAGETNLANNALTAGLVLSEPPPVPDIAVTAISPSSGTAGDTIPITVSVTNRQPTTESFTVVLSNATAGILIGSAPVASLGPNAGTAVTINWNTAAVPANGYTLKATAVPVPGEANLANNSLTSGFTLNAPPPVPDIAVTTLGPATGTAGDTISITVSVTNRQPTTESFTVVLSNATSGVLIGSVPVASLGPNAGTAVVINWNTAGVIPGNYLLKGMTGSVPGETNIANNVLTVGFSLGVPPPLPDIAVTAIGPATGMAGDTIPVTISVTNRQPTTESFTVVLSNATSGVLIGSAPVASLGPNAGTAVTINWDTALIPDGEYTLKAAASLVAGETNLANNVLTSGFALNAPPPVPDIAVTAIGPATGTAGDTIPIMVSITNRQPTTESFTVALSNATSGILIGSAPIASLGPNAGTVVSINWNTTLLPDGEYSLKAAASQVAGETNLVNNALTSGFTLNAPPPVPDIAVTAIGPASGTAGDLLPITISITNRQPTTESFTVALNNTTMGIPINSVEVTALGANAGTNVTIDWDTAGLIPGDYTLEAAAGPVADETNLADNVLSAVLSLSAPPLIPDIAVTAISPGTGVMGDTIPVEITVANQQPTTEAFSLVLSNATSGVLIGSSSIPALGPNASAVITINWNTAGLPAGDYSLRATASPVPGETSLADNTRTSVLSLTLPPGGPQQDGSVSFRVTTLRTYQGIDPINVMAIWVTDSKGRFVRTLKKQAAHREPFLFKWIASSKHNTVDAITGATLTTHLAHKVTWNCRDAAGKLVSNGVYRIMVEMTTQDAQGPVTPATHIKFTKGPKAVTVTPGNLPFFSGMALTYTPVSGRDIAVTGIRPGSGVAGTTVPIVVTVTNLLKTTESFKVVLSDHATGLPLDSVTVPELGPKAGKVVTLPWRTTGLATGHHLLDVAAGPVPGETNVANNVMTTDINLVAPSVVPNDGIVRFSVTTLRTYRDFDPKNIMAIWVADANGFFVKTLKKQAGQQEGYLLTWLASSKSDVTDAITGATLNAHKTHKVTWNCRDTSGLVVPNGTYRIMVEMTTGDGQGPITPAGHIKFLKGKKAVTVTPANLPTFSGMSLTFTPAKAAAFAAAAPPERASAATTTRAAAPVLAVAAPPVTTAVVAAANGVLVTGKGSTLIVQQADADGVFQTAGIIDLPGAIQGVAASGTTVVTANGAEGVFIVDITNPAEPALAGAYPTEGPAVAVALDGATLYVADEIAGLIAVDIADPAEPVLLGLVE